MTPQDATGPGVRTGNADSEAQIKQAAARLLGIVAERARANAESRDSQVRRTIQKNREDIESGRLIDAHLCADCAEGYVSGELGRFCPTGKAQVLQMAGLAHWR
jgi:hypothetical protein